MRKAICFVLAMITAFCITACQRTPETPVVVNKTGELEKKIMQPAVSDNPMLATLPDRWKEDKKFECGVALIIDACIEIPQSKTYTVIEALPHAFTLEEAQKYVGILMRGQPVYEIEPSRIKSDWEEDILRVKAEIESTKNDGSLTEAVRGQTIDDLEAELEYLEGRYNDSPEKRGERVPASISFVRQSAAMQVLGVEADLGQRSPAMLDIHISDDNMENGVMFYDGSEDDYSFGLYGETFAGMALTKQEAQRRVEELLNNLGIKDMRLEYTEMYAVSDDYSVSDHSVLANDPEVKKCYIFSYCPVVSGIPVTVNRFYYGSYNLEEYDKVWHSEIILVYVNDEGVYRMDWYGPDDLGQVLNENAALLDFEEIKGIFSKQMFYKRSWTSPGTNDTEITIESVRLGMMRVRLNENTYVYLPVWDFIGDWTYLSDGVECGMYDVSFLTVNAIDGSVIDRGVGY